MKDKKEKKRKYTVHPEDFRTVPPKKMFTAERLQKGWEDYLFECKNATIEHPTARGEVVIINKPRVPTMGGFKVFMKINDQTWINYATAEGYEETHGVCKNISEAVLSYKLDGLVNGDGNTNGIIFDLKVNHGLNERSIIDQNINGGISVEFSFE